MLSLDLTAQTTLSGFISTVAVLVLTIIRQRRFDVTDIGSFAAAYLSGSNIPAAIFLCWYGLDPDPLSVPTKLHGYEKYVAFAGLSLLILSTVTFWSLCQKAFAVTVVGTEEQRKNTKTVVGSSKGAPNPGS